MMLKVLMMNEVSELECAKCGESQGDRFVQGWQSESGISVMHYWKD